MAAALLKHQLDNRSPDTEIRSAGLGALIGYPADDTAQSLMRDKGTDISEHRAQQVSAELLQWADLVLVMGTGQKQALLESHPHARGKVFLLGHWTDEEIPDPYQENFEVYQQALDIIERGVQAWTTKIAPEKKRVET